MFKESFSLYNRQITQVIMMSVFLVIPLTLFCYFATFYVFHYLEGVEYPHLFAFVLIVVNFTLTIPPFMNIALKDLKDEEQLTVFRLFLIFFRNFGIILLVTILFYVLEY